MITDHDRTVCSSLKHFDQSLIHLLISIYPKLIVEKRYCSVAPPFDSTSKIFHIRNTAGISCLGHCMLQKSLQFTRKKSSEQGGVHKFEVRVYFWREYFFGVITNVLVIYLLIKVFLIFYYLEIIFEMLKTLTRARSTGMRF